MYSPLPGQPRMEDCVVVTYLAATLNLTEYEMIMQKEYTQTKWIRNWKKMRDIISGEISASYMERRIILKRQFARFRIRIFMEL